MLVSKERTKTLPKNVVYPITKSQTTQVDGSGFEIEQEDKSGLSETVELYEHKTLDVDIKMDVDKETSNNKTADVSYGKVSKNQNEIIQSGNQSLKKFQTRVITTQFDKEGNYIMPTVKEEKYESIEPFPTETVNKFKTQYKSGYQVQADVERISGREKLELKEVTIPEKIEQRGYWGNISYSNSNGYNGHQKLKLIERSGTKFPTFM